jgi:hypothetical protein
LCSAFSIFSCSTLSGFCTFHVATELLKVVRSILACVYSARISMPCCFVDHTTRE